MKNIDLIIKVLEERAEKYGVFTEDVSSYELFFVHGRVETVRKSEHASANVTVYAEHDGKMGNAGFGLDASAGENEIARKTDEAIKRAKMIFDEPYSLVSDASEVNATVPSNIADRDEKEIGADVAEAVSKACGRAKCGINALEIFVTKTASAVRNSEGVNKKQTKYKVEIEAIPTCDGDGGSVELYEAYSYGDIDLDGITREISARLDDVSARAHAIIPSQAPVCPVILGANDLQTLFEEIVSDADYAREYMHANLKSIGDAWQSAPAGDRLNVTVRGVMQGSPASNLFDREGTTLKDRKIIEDGKIIAGYGTNRFAQYLKREATGALGCIDVECGNTEYAQMLATPHLECVYLSGLQVDLYNDYIGGEIRLAYYFDGKNRVPVTGIAMSGKLSEALNSMTMSKERVTVNGYSGPAKIKLDNIKIF